MKKKYNVIKIQCASCERETNHKKEWEKRIHETFGKDEDIWQDTIYEAYSCQGCNNITFRIVSVNSEDFEYDDKDVMSLTEHINYYPKRSNRMIKEYIDIYDAPPKVRRVYHETIEAYNNELPILCAIGIRAIIEAICLAENITVQGLDKKIDALIEKRIITTKLGEGLQENRLLGNESAHELESFGDLQLVTAIKLIENIIEVRYSTSSKIEYLKARKFNKRTSKD